MKPLKLLHPGEYKFSVAETFTKGETIDRHLLLFCAEPCAAGRAYCPEHAAIVYRPSVTQNDRGMIETTHKTVAKV